MRLRIRYKLVYIIKLNTHFVGLSSNQWFRIKARSTESILKKHSISWNHYRVLYLFVLWISKTFIWWYNLPSIWNILFQNNKTVRLSTTSNVNSWKYVIKSISTICVRLTHLQVSTKWCQAWRLFVMIVKCPRLVKRTVYDCDKFGEICLA